MSTNHGRWPVACGRPLQIGQHDHVLELAPPLLENWQVRKSYKRDMLLALALACCGRARDMLAFEQVRARYI